MKATLRPHQTRAIAAVRASLLAGCRRPMVSLPTGAGKTVIAAAIIEGALAKGKRVLFVAPFLSLIDQTVEAFAAQDIASVGVMQGYHPLTDGTQPVQVCSMQTLRHRITRQAEPTAKLEVSLPALVMCQHGDLETLEKLRAGHRMDPMVRRYFDLCGVV